MEERIDLDPTNFVSPLSVVFSLLYLGVFFVGLYKVFVKAGEPGYHAFIPLYSLVLLFRISGRPGAWAWSLLFPPLFLAFYVSSMLDLARVFGKSPRFGLGLVFFPQICIPVLGFGSAQYLGKRGVGDYDSRQRVLLDE